MRAFADTAPPRPDRDALIVAGSNDITDEVARPRRLLKVLRSGTEADDRRFRNRLASRIAANIKESVDILTGQGVDEIVIVGIAPLSRTPFVRDKAAALSGTLGPKLLRFVNGTARRVNSRLDALYNNPSLNADVLAVDGFQVWNSVAAPRFLDDVHPTSRTSARLADAVVSRIAASSELSSYGLSA